MKKTTVEFAIVKGQNGLIKNIGKSSILHPKTNFKGKSDSIKWYEDRPKKKNN